MLVRLLSKQTSLFLVLGSLAFGLLSADRAVAEPLTPQQLLGLSLQRVPSPAAAPLRAGMLLVTRALSIYFLTQSKNDVSLQDILRFLQDLSAQLNRTYSSVPPQSLQIWSDATVLALQAAIQYDHGAHDLEKQRAVQQVVRLVIEAILLAEAKEPLIFRRKNFAMTYFWQPLRQQLFTLDLDSQERIRPILEVIEPAPTRTDGLSIALAFYAALESTFTSGCMGLLAPVRVRVDFWRNN